VRLFPAFRLFSSHQHAGPDLFCCCAFCSCRQDVPSVQAAVRVGRARARCRRQRGRRYGLCCCSAIAFALALLASNSHSLTCLFESLLAGSESAACSTHVHLHAGCAHILLPCSLRMIARSGRRDVQERAVVRVPRSRIWLRAGEPRLALLLSLDFAWRPALSLECGVCQGLQCHVACFVHAAWAVSSAVELPACCSIPVPGDGQRDRAAV
jgi:hypothetical protein